MFVSKLRAQGVDPIAIRLALLAGHYRSDREWTDELLTAAQERLDRWRAAVALRRRPARRRPRPAPAHRLADDLDTPGALAAVDAGPGEALERRGTDPAAPGLVRAAVDALLGCR